jgi:class 3 adenylate cyclase
VTISATRPDQGEAEAPPPPDEPTRHRERVAPKKPLRRGGLSIQSKLLIMLLAVSLVSSVIVGMIGFVSGRESLRAAAVEQLTTIRELRAHEMENAMASLQQGVTLDSRNLSAQNASIALNDGFAQLQNASLTAEQEAELEAYYADTFIPALEERSNADYGESAFIPQSAAGRYLQYWYTRGAPVEGEGEGADTLTVADAGDGSPYSSAHAEYHDYFQRLIEEIGYLDLLVMNTEGDVVYTANKGVDLGTNLLTGPYRDTLLAGAYRDVLATNSVESVQTTDFERYIPSLNVPTLWVVSPIGSDAGVTGTLAAQIPIETINDVMTGSESWAEQGLGRTGEVYLAGRDDLMRSISRGLVESPEEYAEQVIRNGTPPDVAERIVDVDGTILLQPVDTFSVNEAQQGRTGSAITRDYTGGESITAYRPLDIEGLEWVAVARISSDEAFAPVSEFTRNLVLSTLAILLAVSVISLLLAQVFTRPIRRLVDAVRRIAGGDLAVQVPHGSRDEFGDLGTAFNDMASSLRIKQELIDQQKQENEKLLHTLMPASVARRYRDGEESIAEQHDNVAVVFGELVGFDEHAAALTSEQEIAQLNTIMRGFDEAAEKAGVEKVRSLRGGYLASSGLIVPRVDNVRRAVEFAREMRSSIERFNAQHGTSIDVRAGVDTGTVTSGLVARTNLAFDLWGDAVSLAYRVRSVSGEPGIYVSQTVRERMPDSVEFEEAGVVELKGGQQTVWRVV